MPEGAYWIPMEQPQKHWIQATLGEDPYAPFPYFYDVSSWSNPLLMGIDTIYTGDELSPEGRAGEAPSTAARRPTRQSERLVPVPARLGRVPRSSPSRCSGAGLAVSRDLRRPAWSRVRRGAV